MTRFGRWAPLSMWGGALLLLWLALDRPTGLSLRGPQKSWLALIGILGFGWACWRLWTDRSVVTAWRPRFPGRRFQSIRFYTRQNCPLCDEAAENLQHYHRYLPKIEFVDVDSDDTLKQHFGNSVPVVEIDGRIRFRGGLSEVLLKRLIEGTPPWGTLPIAKT